MLKWSIASGRVAQRGCMAVRRSARLQRSSASLFHSTAQEVATKSEEEEPLPPSWTEKYKLNDPTRWVPITVASFGLATWTGLYHWDEESQMLGLFVIFCGTVYTQAGPSIAQFLDDEAAEELKEVQETEEKNIDMMKEKISEIEPYATYDQKISAMIEAQKKMEAEVRDSVGLSFEKRKQAFFQSKLDRILAIEAEAKANLQKTLITKAADKVKHTFETDSALQKKSLKTALAWLSSAEGNRKDPSEVGNEFKKFFAAAKKDKSITKDIEDKMNQGIERIVSEKFEIVDEYKFLKGLN